MKKIKAAIILLTILTLTFGTAFAFTWEGELNPDEFDNWNLISVQPTSRGYLWVFMENPDQTSPIDVVVMEVDSDSMLRGYRYFKYGEPHIYIFDNSQQKYVRHHLTDEQKKSCLKCHRKAVPLTLI